MYMFLYGFGKMSTSTETEQTNSKIPECTFDRLRSILSKEFVLIFQHTSELNVLSSHADKQKFWLPVGQFFNKCSLTRCVMHRLHGSLIAKHHHFVFDFLDFKLYLVLMQE